jgi:hypothetical protein
MCDQKKHSKKKKTPRMLLKTTRAPALARRLFGRQTAPSPSESVLKIHGKNDTGHKSITQPGALGDLVIYGGSRVLPRWWCFGV